MGSTGVQSLARLSRSCPEAPFDECGDVLSSRPDAFVLIKHVRCVLRRRGNSKHIFCSPTCILCHVASVDRSYAYALDPDVLQRSYLVPVSLWCIRPIYTRRQETWYEKDVGLVFLLLVRHIRWRYGTVALHSMY